MFWGHSKQSMIVMDTAAKEKEKKADQDRIKGEGTTAKNQLAAANALLDKYRARYPGFEEKKVEASADSSAAKFTYNSLESGEFVEKLATSYDAADKGDIWNSDGANDVIEGAEKRS